MLLPFFEWMEALTFSAIVRESWLSAAVNVAHILALVVFAGAVLIVDLRLLGTGLKERPVTDLARDARPWLVWGLVALAVTGIPQLTSTAIKQYYSDFFWFKMQVLVVALAFTFTLRQWVVDADERRVGSVSRKLAGLASIALWLGVAVPARLIGLLSG